MIKLKLDWVGIIDSFKEFMKLFNIFFGDIKISWLWSSEDILLENE